jgi:DNA-binding response OmpR family regulator
MPRVLIVDDDDDFRAFCRILLEEAGFEVSEADGVESGFREVSCGDPDILILDVLMPSDYEGFQLARRVRDELKRKDLPILMLTAVHDVKKPPYRFAQHEAYLPVDGFLDKPVPPEVLLRKVREMLGLHREQPSEPL